MSLVEVTPSYIRGLMLENDLANKAKIAAILRERYGTEGWYLLSADQVLKDLVFCWMLKAYFIGAHECLIAFSLGEGDDIIASKLALLREMYKNAHFVTTTIDDRHNGDYFGTAIGSLDFNNPGN